MIRPLRSEELEEFARDISAGDAARAKVIEEYASAALSSGVEPGKVAEHIMEAAKAFQKQDSGKAPLAILFDTARALDGVVRVMAYGADKYDRKNWDKVDDLERYISAALRHISAHCQGEFEDGESGLDHLDHAICSLLFVSEIMKRNLEMEE